MPESLYRPRSWRVGLADSPAPQDRSFDSEDDAIKEAAAMAEIIGFYSPVAVWDHRDDPVWLFMLGCQFRSM